MQHVIDARGPKNLSGLQSLPGIGEKRPIILKQKPRRKKNKTKTAKHVGFNFPDLGRPDDWARLSENTNIFKWTADNEENSFSDEIGINPVYKIEIFGAPERRVSFNSEVAVR